MILSINNSHSSKPSTDYKVYAIDSIQDIDSIDPLWKTLQFHPNSDIEFYKAIISARQNVLYPYILVIKKGSIPVSLFIGRVERIKLESAIGYKSIFSQNMKCLTFVYKGFLGDNNEEILKCFIDYTKEVLITKNYDCIMFEYIEKDGLLNKLLKQYIPLYCRDIFVNDVLHWRFKIPNNPDELFINLKSKRKRWLRSLPRKLNNDFSDRVKICEYNSLSQLDRVLEDAEHVARATYQRGLSVGFINDQEVINRLKLYAERNQLLSYFLYIDERPCAFWIGNIYKDSLHLVYTSYLPEYKKYELGTILLTRIMRDICNNYTGVKLIDFGFGDAFYKRRFCSDFTSELNILLFSPTFKSVYVNTVRTIITILSKSLKYIFNKYNLENKVKRLWRDKLEGNS